MIRFDEADEKIPLVSAVFLSFFFFVDDPRTCSV